MNSLKRISIAVLMILASFGFNGTLSGAESSTPVTGTASLGVFNRYVFRGYRLGRDSLVFQPSLSLSYKGFSASFWGNIDSREKATPSFIPDRPGRKSFNEADITLSYAITTGKLSLTTGFIYYGTKYAPETQEIYVGAGLNIIGKPTLTVYQDIDAYPGTYFLLTLAQSFPVAKRATLELGASAAYFLGEGDYWRTYFQPSGGYTGNKYRAFHDGLVKAGLTFPLNGNVGLQLVMQCVFPLSKAASRTIDGNPYNINGNLSTVMMFGLNLTYGF